MSGGAFLQPLEQARITSRIAADGYRRKASLSSVAFHRGDQFMNVLHVGDSAIRHQMVQVPFGHLIENASAAQISVMNNDFRDALLWHMERYEIGTTELARKSGVSLDIIKKLRTRANANTKGINPTKIAAAFGKTLPEFLRCEEGPSDTRTRLLAMIDLLEEDEERFVLRQIQGMIAGREPK